MGHRTLKRVPLDFSWPLHKVWEGYTNPHYRKCPDCKAGYSNAGEMLSEIVQGLMWHRTDDEEMIALTTGLAGRSPIGRLIGHDSIDAYVARKKIVKAARLPKSWGVCKTCKGSAEDPSTKRRAARWRKKEPPKGDGWQLWETCSEGSPVSPVFTTKDELAEWCAENATTFASCKASKAQWLHMFSTEDGCEFGTLGMMQNGKIGAAIDFQDRKEPSGGLP